MLSASSVKISCFPSEEQLLAKNIVTSEIFYTDLTLDLVKRYRLFIFYRCPYTDTVGEFIELAKSIINMCCLIWMIY